MNEIINDSCIICFNNIPEDKLCRTNCNHIYCKECLHTWFDRGKVECPMCRINVKSYENNGIINHLIVLNNNNNNNNNNNTNENRIIIEANPNNAVIAGMYKKIKLMKLYFFINLLYMGYLHYKNYTLWEKCDN